MINQKIQKVRILKKLGQGGMGIVYLGVHELLKKKRAVKILPFRSGMKDEWRQRFLREAQAAAHLEHPHIVQVMDVGQKERFYYIIMQFVEGQSLQDILDSHTMLPINRAVAIIGQCLDALSFAHSRGIIHRDIKPDNIMIDQQGKAKVTDFGLARNTSDSSLTATGKIIGTPHYMSPEQALGEEIDNGTDIYSLGVTFYELITGKLPFDGSTAVIVLNQKLHEPFPPPETYRDNIPPVLSEMIQKMCARQAEDRYQDCNEIRQELVKSGLYPGREEFSTAAVTHQVKDTPSQSSPPLRKDFSRDKDPHLTFPGKVKLWAILLGMILMAGGGLFYFQNPGETGQKTRKDRGKANQDQRPESPQGAKGKKHLYIKHPLPALEASQVEKKLAALDELSTSPQKAFWALPYLTYILRDKDPRLRRRALDTIEKLNLTAHILPSLVMLLQDEDQKLVKKSLEILGSLRDKAASTRRVLLGLKQKPSYSSYSREIKAALEKIPPIHLDAAVMWNHKRAYFFKGKEYIRYSIATHKVDRGYPNPILGNYWPHLWTENIDAAIRWPNGKGYLFRGSQYVAYRRKGGYKGSRKKDIGKYWPGLWTRDIDAAILWNKSRAYFFRDKMCQTYDVKRNKVISTRAISRQWPGLWKEGIDAAINGGKGKAYFFKGHQYIRYDIEKKKADPGFPRPIARTWEGMWSQDFQLDSHKLNGRDPRPGDIKILLGPALSFPGPDQVYLWWQTNLAFGPHTIKVGTSKDKLNQTLTSPQWTQYPFFRLQGLKGGVKYYYQISSGQATSPIHSFRLPQRKESFLVSIWADNQSGKGIFKREILPLVRKSRPQFLLVPGDFVNIGKNYYHWVSQFFTPLGDLLASTPWFPVRGNHDGESYLARRICPFPQDQGWYSTSYGPLYIIALNTNLDCRPGSAQRIWLKKKLSSPAWKNAKFRLVTFHHTPFALHWSRKGPSGEPSARQHLVPLLEEAGAHVVICGHVHAYERGRRERKGGYTYYLTVGGGGGKLSKVRSRPWPHIQAAHPVHHLVNMHVSPQKLRFEVLRAKSGQVIDSFEVKSRR